MQWVYHVSPEVNAISQYPTILAVCISLTFVMTVVVCLRVWVRAVWKKSFGVDDAVIVSSAVRIYPIAYILHIHPLANIDR